jgi:hypothetical protein
LAMTRERELVEFVLQSDKLGIVGLSQGAQFLTALPLGTQELSMEHEGIVHKLCPRQVLCVHHKLVRFNPLTYRGGSRRFGGRGRP